MMRRAIVYCEVLADGISTAQGHTMSPVFAKCLQAHTCVVSGVYAILVATIMRSKSLKLIDLSGKLENVPSISTI